MKVLSHVLAHYYDILYCVLHCRNTFFSSLLLKKILSMDNDVVSYEDGGYGPSLNMKLSYFFIRLPYTLSF